MADKERCGHIICFSSTNPGNFSLPGQIGGLNPFQVESEMRRDNARLDISFPIIGIYSSEGGLDGWLEQAQNILGDKYGYYTEDPFVMRGLF